MDTLNLRLARHVQEKIHKLFNTSSEIYVNSSNDFLEVLADKLGGVSTLCLSNVTSSADQHRIRIRFPEKQFEFIIEAFVNLQSIVVDSIRRDNRKNTEHFEVTEALNLIFVHHRHVSDHPSIISQLRNKLHEKKEKDQLKQSIKVWEAYLKVQEQFIRAKTIELEFHKRRFLDNEQVVELGIGKKQLSRSIQELKPLKQRKESIGIFPLFDGSEASEALAKGILVDINEHSIVIQLDREYSDQIIEGFIELPSKGRFIFSPIGDLYQIGVQRKSIGRLIKNEVQQAYLPQILFSENTELDLPAVEHRSSASDTEYLEPEMVNDDQRRAITMALDSPDCFFLQGPPGTGKTTFIVELSYQLVKAGKRVLITSQSNMAVDNALSRLGSSSDILAIRLGGSSKIDSIADDFVGDKAVKRWLKSVAKTSQKRVDALSLLKKQSHLFDTHWVEIVNWLENKDAWNHTIIMSEKLVQENLAQSQNLYSEVQNLKNDYSILDSLKNYIDTNGFELQDGSTHEIEFWSSVANATLFNTWQLDMPKTPFQINHPWDAKENYQNAAGDFKNNVYLNRWEKERQRLERTVSDYLGQLNKAKREQDSLSKLIQGLENNELVHKSICNKLSRIVELPTVDLKNSQLHEISKTTSSIYQQLKKFDAYLGKPVYVGKSNLSLTDIGNIKTAFSDIRKGNLNSKASIIVLNKLEYLDNRRKELETGLMTGFLSMFSKSADEDIKKGEVALKTFRSYAYHVYKEVKSLHSNFNNPGCDYPVKD